MAATHFTQVLEATKPKRKSVGEEDESDVETMEDWVAYDKDVAIDTASVEDDLDTDCEEDEDHCDAVTVDAAGAEKDGTAPDEGAA